MTAPTVFQCRACRSSDCIPVISFGTTPLADALLSKDQLGALEVTAPLDRFKETAGVLCRQRPSDSGLARAGQREH